jgi:hypothetical protein
MPPPGRLDTRRAPRRRPAGDILAGVGAALILLVLLIGVPAALLTVLGSPIPHSMPALSLLTDRLDILAVLKILSVVVWLAWLQLVVCLIAEVRAAVRNTGMPPRVPLAGGIQPAVHWLVTAALLLFSGATALSPALTHQPPGVPSAVSAAPAGRSGGASPAATPPGARGTGWPGPGGLGEPGGQGEPGGRARPPAARDRHWSPPITGCSGPRRSTWSGRRRAGTTKACGRSRRTTSAMAGVTGRSSS